MENDFGIKISAVVDNDSLIKNIETTLKSKTFKINVEVGNIKGQIDKNVKSATGGGTKAQSKGVAADSLGPTIATLSGIAEIQDTLNAENELLGSRVKIMKNLNESTVQYYTVGESGELELAKTVETTNTGLAKQLKEKERLVKVEEKNEMALYKSANLLKNYSQNGRITADQTQEFTKRLEELKTKGLDPIGKSKAIEKFNSDLRTMASISSQSSGLKFFISNMRHAITAIASWGVATTAVYGTIHAIERLIKEVKNLDDSLIELNKVWDATSKQVEDLTEKAFKLADSVGSVGTEMIDAITEFKRMGYTIEESTNLAETAAIMVNVAEGITSTGEAANTLASILKGLGVSSEYAESVLNRINEVSNNSAVQFDQLADMMQESAATMDILGNTFDETIGLITGGFEVLQDEKVAKGIQTIGLRIAGLNEDMESVEGLSNQVVEALDKIAGVKAFDEQTGQIRSTYAIMKDLSEVWEELDQNEQSALLNTLAGKQRADVAAAILSNWEGVEKAINSAAHSTGSAREEQEAYLESIQAGMVAIQNAIQEIANNLISSDLIKGTIDVVNAVLSLLKPLSKIVGYVIKIGGLANILKSLSRVIEFIGEMADKILYFTDKGYELSSQIMDLIGNIGFSVLNTVFSLVEEFFDWLFDIAQPILGWIDKLIEKIGELKDNVVGFFKDVVGFIGGLFGKKEEAEDLADTFVKTVKAFSDLDKLERNAKEYNFALKERLETIKEENEEIEKQKQMQEKLLKVEEARQALADARNKRIRVFRAGTGFVYGEDAAEVQSAQKALTTALDDLADYKYDIALEKAQDFIDKLTDILSGDDIREGWAELFDEFNVLMGTEFESFLTGAKDIVDDFNNIVGSDSKVHIKTTNIDTNADGTRNFGGGLTWVGERGPELLNLPRGSEILSNAKSMKLHDIANSSFVANKGSGSTVLQFNGDLSFPNITNPNDANNFIGELLRIGNSTIPKLA